MLLLKNIYFILKNTCLVVFSNSSASSTRKSNSDHFFSHLELLSGSVTTQKSTKHRSI